MLDSVELEGRGIPTVTITTHWFTAAARAQAALVGHDGMSIVGMTYVGGGGQGHWMSNEEREAMIDLYWPDIVAGLTGAASSGEAGA